MPVRSPEIPEFLTRAGLARQAYEFAAEAHVGQKRKGGESPYIAHPVEVARLLDAEGVADEELLAAAFLHDVVEDTDHALEEIYDGFGDGVGELVEAMTEDRSVEPYEARKEHHRDQVEAAGERTALIYSADKLANVRDMRTIYASIGEAAASRFKAPIDVRVRLWRGDVEMLDRLVPELALVDELRSELEAFEAERATTA
jgi:(p)ppGpp synthase/HD superfamily hydrolase